MIKIIKYSIPLIIFSIMLSLFILYFYLLRGLTISNIHFNSINIKKLYIKIDKKIILKIKNITILNNKSKKSSKIDFLKLKSQINKNIKYLNYIDSIEIQNLNINNQNKIDLIFFRKNNLIIKNKEITLNSNIDFKKTAINIQNLNIKKYNIIFKNILVNLNFNKNLNIHILNQYHNTNITANIEINSNSNVSYTGSIENITKKTILPFKIPSLNQLFIYNIEFNGNLKQANFTLTNLKTKYQQYYINTKNIYATFIINNKKLIINNKKTDIEFNSKTLTVLDTNISYINKDLNLHNKKLIFKMKNLNVITYNNDINYTKDLITIHLDKVNSKYKNINNKINNVYATYKNQILKSNISNIEIFKKDFYSKLLNTKITYKNNKAKIYIPTIYNNINKSKSNIYNTNITYAKNQTNIKINEINIKNQELFGTITSTNIIFKPKSQDLFIYNNKAFLQYKNIKHISLFNINTIFNLKKNILKTNIPVSYINKIKLNKLKLYLKHQILTTSFYTNTLLSKNLNKILRTFNIKNHIYQKNGKNNIKAKIIYNLKTNKLNTNININVKHSKLMLTKSVFLDIKKAQVQLKNSNIFLKNTDFDYNVSILNLNYYINNGVIDLNKLNIKTQGKFKELNITNILAFKNKPENLFVDLNNLDIFLKKLNVNIAINKDIIVDINKIKNLTPYNKELQKYKINDGKTRIIIGDKIKIISNITKTNQHILLKNLKPLKKLNINTIINGNTTKVYNKDININIHSSKNTMKVFGDYKNLDINVTEFVDQNQSDDNSTVIANIEAKNSFIVYKNMKLYSKKLSINYDGKNAKISSLYNDRNITVLYNNGGFKLYGLNVKEKTFKELTNSDFLNEPLLTVFIIKRPKSDTIYGEIDIKKGYIKELKAFNNVVAFINLIPSLVTFQAAGFSSKGYKINKGRIDFILNDNILYINYINIEGENITFTGKGKINLKKNTIDMQVNVNLIIKLIKDIPIVNYILLGKDGGVTINLGITGNLDDPKIHKNTISNIVKAPLNILKRLILTPFRPFMKEDEE